MGIVWMLLKQDRVDQTNIYKLLCIVRGDLIALK